MYPYWRSIMKTNCKGNFATIVQDKERVKKLSLFLYSCCLHCSVRLLVGSSRGVFSLTDNLQKNSRSLYSVSIYFFLYLLMWKILACYLVLINLATFIIRGIDKRKAKNGKWRISENMLLKLSLAWGRIWAILAIWYFRHKTIKSQFLWRFYLVGFLWIFALFVLAYFS